MKYYAVKKGRVPGVYRTWEEAKAQVEGYSGAQYQAFDQIMDAIAFAQISDRDRSDAFENALRQIHQKSSSPKPNSNAANPPVRKPAQPLHPKNHVSQAKTGSYAATIYTDGGSRNTGVHVGGHVKKTDKAAWAYLIQTPSKRYHDSGGEYGATNNKMEQTAVIQALRRLLALGLNDEKLLFVLDSKYVLNAINKRWLWKWEKNGWKKSGGVLKNAAQWQQIAGLLHQFSQTEFVWTKGHAGNQGNEFVDHALNAFMDQMPKKRPSPRD